VDNEWVMVMSEEGKGLVVENLRDDVFQDFVNKGFKWSQIASMLQVSTSSIVRWRRKTNFDEKPQNVPLSKK